MDNSLCNIDYVLDASDVPLNQQLSRDLWFQIKDNAPMLVRTVNGKKHDVRLHRDTLLR